MGWAPRDEIGKGKAGTSLRLLHRGRPSRARRYGPIHDRPPCHPRSPRPRVDSSVVFAHPGRHLDSVDGLITGPLSPDGRNTLLDLWTRGSESQLYLLWGPPRPDWGSSPSLRKSTVAWWAPCRGFRST